MDNLIQIASVPAITGIVFSAMEIYKRIIGKHEALIRLIPIISIILGIILGIAAFFCFKSIMPADNILTAILVGAASGAAATGTNQIFKQILKFLTDKKEGNDSEKNADN
jgi:uncharacterized membrane protein